MAPFPVVLHYLEGDSIPLSHVYPLFQCLFDYANSLASCVADVFADMGEGIEVMIIELITDRWEGTSRLVGLRHDVHLATFFFDPFAQAAVKDPTLITQRVCAAADRCVTKLARGEPRAGAMVKQMLQAFEGGTNLAVKQKWEAARLMTEQRISESDAMPDPITAGIQDEFSSVGLEVYRMVHNLKQADHPTTMWIAAGNIVADNMNTTRAAAHAMFSAVIVDLESIVGHTSATERHGKGYKLIHTTSRSRILGAKLNRAMFVFNNYNLLTTASKFAQGIDIHDFAHGFLTSEELELEEGVQGKEGLDRHLLEGDGDVDSDSSDGSNTGEEDENNGQEDGDEEEGEVDGDGGQVAVVHACSPSLLLYVSCPPHMSISVACELSPFFTPLSPLDGSFQATARILCSRIYSYSE